MPRKRSRASAIRQPLAFALATPAKVAALRVLAGTGEPITQRDVARRAAVQHRAMQRALDELVLLGIVTRQVGGRDYLVRITDTHRLATPLRELFSAETGHFLELRARLAETAQAIARRAGLVNVALFGSAARGGDTPESDCDLLVIARDAAGLASAMDAFTATGAVLRQSHGCRLAPIGYLRADAARRWRARSAPFAGIEKDLLTVFGPPLAEALRGPA